MTPWCRGRPTMELYTTTGDENRRKDRRQRYHSREDGSGSIVTGETSLAHTGTIVNDLDVSLIDDEYTEQLTSAATSSSLFGQLQFISLHINSHFDDLF